MPDYCFAAITISIPSDVVEGYVGFPTPNNLRSLTQAVKFIVTPSVTYVICDDIKQFGRPQTIHSRILFSRTWLLEIFFHITACRSLHHYFSQRVILRRCVFPFVNSSLPFLSCILALPDLQILSRISFGHCRGVFLSHRKYFA